MYLSALGEYLSDREQTLKNLRYAKRMLTHTDFIDEDIRQTVQELELLSDMIRICINGNAANTLSEQEYRQRHTELCKRFEEAEKKLNELKSQREQTENDSIVIGGLLFELTELTELLVVFDERLWNATVDRVTVCADERIVFRFKDGREVARWI